MNAVSSQDEMRIRQAIRQAIKHSREEDGAIDVQYVFDLLPFLRAEAGEVAQDETARALAEFVGGD